MEIGIKFINIVNQVSWKAITQVLHNGSGNIGGKKRREDVTTFVPMRRTFVNDNSPQHYITSQDPQYPVT